MSSFMDKHTVEVFVPKNAELKRVSTILDQINRKSEEGRTVFKLNINPGRHIVDIPRNIRVIKRRRPESTFLILRNDFIKEYSKFSKALKLAGAEFYNEDENQDDDSLQFLAQDFLIFNKHGSNLGSYIANFESYTEAIIRVNYNCNEKCKFCWLHEDETAVAPEKIKKVIAQLIEQNSIKHFVFTGGEPTLLKELPELISFAKDKGAKQVVLQTNGVLLADKKRVDQLVSCGLDQVFLALHSNKEEISEEITGLKGSFDKTVQALENFMQTDVEVVIDHVLSKENIQHVESFAEFVVGLYHKHRHEVTINFAVAQPMGKYAKIFLQHTPTITELREYLVRAMFKLYESPVLFNGFCMASGPPLCAVNGNAKFLGELQEVNSNELKDDFVKIDSCQKCKLTDYCYGVRRIYAEHFGTDEIEPIKH